MVEFFSLYWEWFAFSALVGTLLLLDLFVFHRHDHTPSLRESAGWTIFWCSLALAFNVFIWYDRGPQAGTEFLTGYIIEWSLSMDNVFVFAVIFRFFNVPMMYQYRVLFWGILGAILMRLVFVLLGAALISRFEWIIPVFGFFLVYTAIKLALQHDNDVDPEHNILLRLARKLVPVTRENHERHGHSFFVHEEGRTKITPLFLVLLVIESTDVLFAVDSVPAIFGITRDPFIVFTSNIFAIMGLRALYFLLAGVITLFRFLHYGLSAVLAFVGLNMLADYIAHRFYSLEEGVHLIPTGLKLGIIASLIAISIIASVVLKPKQIEKEIADADERNPRKDP